MFNMYQMYPNVSRINEDEGYRGKSNFFKNI